MNSRHGPGAQIKVLALYRGVPAKTGQMPSSEEKLGATGGRQGSKQQKRQRKKKASESKWLVAKSEEPFIVKTWHPK